MGKIINHNGKEVDGIIYCPTCNSKEFIRGGNGMMHVDLDKVYIDTYRCKNCNFMLSITRERTVQYW